MFLFLFKNFLANSIFHLRSSFQVRYGCPELSFTLSFRPMNKSRVMFLDRFLGYKILTYTRINMVMLGTTIRLTSIAHGPVVISNTLSSSTQPN